MNRFAIVFLISTLWISPQLGAAQNPTMVVDMNLDRHPISPFIYGTNAELRADDGYTARRFGGNRSTAYNWTNNASNAGADWKHSSDSFIPSTLKVPAELSDSPGQALFAFHEQSIKLKVPFSLLTLPLAGYVAADKNGPVEPAEAAPSSRWTPVFASRTSEPARQAQEANPELLSKALFLEDLLELLTKRFGKADSPRGIRGYVLDNEPALWHHTHGRMHPRQASCSEIVTKGIDAARVVKGIDPAAQVFGPEAYGFMEYASNQDAVDWPVIRDAQAQEGNPYRWYLDYYLDSFRKASEQAGTRLLDALSIHWYPEARGGNIRITEKEQKNPLTNRARMQAPRSLWDPSYIEDSWIKRSASWGTPLLPILKESLDTWYPGTKLAITEYNYGGDMHVSGGIAQADVLGIFGRYGVYLATLWPMGGKGNYVSAAFKLYRNADGKGLAFGDTAVQTENSNTIQSSLYASTESTNNKVLHLVIINKSEDAPLVPDLTIKSPHGMKVAGAWGFDSEGSRLRPMDGGMAMEGNKLRLSIPPLSACHVYLEAQ